jgi:hypothetical protein
MLPGASQLKLTFNTKVNRDRYNIDGPECKKRAYMYLELRTLNNMEI